MPAKLKDPSCISDEQKFQAFLMIKQNDEFTVVQEAQILKFCESSMPEKAVGLSSQS